jgi:hypothetical protein
MGQASSLTLLGLYVVTYNSFPTKIHVVYVQSARPVTAQFWNARDLVILWLCVERRRLCTTETNEQRAAGRPAGLRGETVTLKAIRLRGWVQTWYEEEQLHNDMHAGIEIALPSYLKLISFLWTALHVISFYETFWVQYFLLTLQN